MKRIRNLIFAGLIAFSGGISPVASPAFADPPGVSYEIFYYSDFSQSTLVGHYREYCDGSSNGWGSITEWNAAYYYNC